MSILAECTICHIKQSANATDDRRCQIMTSPIPILVHTAARKHGPPKNRNGALVVGRTKRNVSGAAHCVSGINETGQIRTYEYEKY